MLKYLRYRYAKTKMTAYINGELPENTRRFVGRLINEDERIYNEYIRQRQTKQKLERELPTFGRPDAGQLSAVWANIQAEMSKPEKPDTPPASRPRYSLSYAVAAVMFALAVLIPFAFDASHASAAASPQKSVPETVEFTTPDNKEPSAQPTSIAVAAAIQTQAQVTDEVNADLQNTPAPRTPGE
jgi:anti-sigma factor RsiW